jgi:hypothetical protein
MDTIHLRLYKEPLHEVYAKDVVRLLFEAVAPDDASQKKVIDFYMYVWIAEGKRLTGFQAILDNAITLVYRAPSYITVGRIGHAPINRSIQGVEAGAVDDNSIRGAMQGFQNEEFPDLVAAIEGLAHGQSSAEVMLSEREKTYFAELVKSRSSS